MRTILTKKERPPRNQSVQLPPHNLLRPFPPPRPDESKLRIHIRTERPRDENLPTKFRHVEESRCGTNVESELIRVGFMVDAVADACAGEDREAVPLFGTRVERGREGVQA